MKSLYRGLLAGLILGVGLAIVFKGSRDFLLIGGAVLGIVTAPAGILCFCMAWYDLKTSTELGPVTIKWGSLTASAITCFTTTHFLGTTVNQIEISRAKAFVIEVAPILETHKEQRGSYPSTLAEIHSGSVPTLLRKERCFATDGFTYRFLIMDHSNGQAYFFSNEEKEWQEFGS